jgi:hypothetical protein
MTMHLGFRGRSALAGLVLAVGGLSAGFLSTVHWAGSSSASERAAPVRPRAGTEFLVVALLSSDCGASKYPGLKDAVARIHQVLRTDAKRDGKSFVSVGVALDHEPWQGIEFLKNFGAFDEVLAGGSWLNTGAIAYLVRDLPGRRAVPQLVFIERDVELENGTISTVNDRLAGRKTGADAIIRFADALALSHQANGAPTDADGPTVR